MPDRFHDYLYWDYGHCRDRCDQAVRTGKWKGLRLGRDTQIEPYDLETDPGKTNDIAREHPDIATQIESIMKDVVRPDGRYPVGTRYAGKPLRQFGN